MRKSTRIGKRLMALFLVLLLSIESFAATVGDNDGAAFITKAEFDSLKNTFQAQIDQYNSSIDNKIDGAIASYLAGVKVSRTEHVPLVDWWAQARFMDDVMIYSRQVTYTSANDKTTSDLKWHRPNTGNRIELESGVLWCCSDIRENYGASIQFRVGGSLDLSAAAGATGSGLQNAKSGVGEWLPDVNRYALAPTLLFLYMDTNGDWVFNDGLGSGKHVNTWIARSHMYADIYDFLWKSYQNDEWTPGNDADAFEVLTPDDGKVYNFKLYFVRNSTGVRWWVQDSPNIEDIVMPYWFGDLPLSCPQTNVNMVTLNTTELRTMDMYDTADDRTKDKDNFKYLMLGRKQDWKLLTAHRSNKLSAVNTNTKDNEHSIRVSARWNINQRYMMYGLSRTTTNTLSTGTHYAQVSFPKWDEATASEIQNGAFYYKNKAIKIGQGIPLGDRGISGNGQAKIVIKFEKKNVRTGLDASNKKVAVKIKKNDFLSDGDYATGTKDGSTSSVTFNDAFYLDTGTEYTLKVDMNKDDQLWLQLSPAGGASNIYTGDYARLTKLTMNYEIE